MLLTERTMNDPERYDAETEWYLADGYDTVFIYFHGDEELVGFLEDPYGLPVAHPKTLAEARAIIGRNGCTIS